MIGRKVEKSLMLSDIYETAKMSAGLPASPDSDAIRIFRMMLAEGQSPIRLRNAIEDRAVELLSARANYQPLRTICLSFQPSLVLLKRDLELPDFCGELLLTSHDFLSKIIGLWKSRDDTCLTGLWNPSMYLATAFSVCPRDCQTTG